jgi:hypothetical protein
MHDQPDVVAHSDRPKFLIPRLVEPVEIHPRLCGVHLEVERRHLDGLLFVAGQTGKAVGERISDTEFHHIRP